MRSAIWRDLLYGTRTGAADTTTSITNKIVDADSAVEVVKVGEGGKAEVNSSTIASITQIKSKTHPDIGTNGSRIVSTGLCLAADVDIAAIASKYELTGGFIKNAVLSALLSAISRASDKEKPEICQVNRTAKAFFSHYLSLPFYRVLPTSIDLSGIDIYPSSISLILYHRCFVITVFLLFMYFILMFMTIITK